MDNPTLAPHVIWDRVFQRVQRTVNTPMLWLAIQAAKPITADGNFFVIGLAADKEYLATNLQTFENTTAIEDALREVAGHILALRLIEGETLEDWLAIRAKEHAAPLDFEPPPADTTPPPNAGASPLAAELPREIFPTWEKMNERLQQMYKTAPAARYPHGQARFVLEAVKYVSDMMDLLMPGPGQPPDDQADRNLSRALERLSSVVNLDAIFLSLELFRYRASRGKH